MMKKEEKHEKERQINKREENRGKRGKERKKVLFFILLNPTFSGGLLKLGMRSVSSLM